MVVALPPSGGSRLPPPVATITVDMVDFAYRSSETWPAGRQLIRVVNRGVQDHQLRIERLNDGVTLREVMEADDPSLLVQRVAGVARMSAGREALLPIELVPGNYMLSCLVADPGSRRPHVELGMVRMVRVE